MCFMDYFLSSWCLTTKKGAANPDSKYKGIITSNYLLFSTKIVNVILALLTVKFLQITSVRPPNTKAVRSSAVIIDAEVGRNTKTPSLPFLTTVFPGV